MCKCISTQPLDQAARLRILRQCCWSANESLVNWPGWLRIPTPAAWSLSPVDVYVESVLDVPVTPCALPLTAMIQHCFKVSPPQGCSYQVYQGRRTASHPNKFKLLVSWGQPPQTPPLSRPGSLCAWLERTQPRKKIWFALHQNGKILECSFSKRSQRGCARIRFPCKLHFSYNPPPQVQGPQAFGDSEILVWVEW